MSSAASTPKGKRPLQSSKSIKSATNGPLDGKPPAACGLLEAFPPWADLSSAEKEPAGKFEDPLGALLPAAAQPFCDAWKRTEELLYGTPNVPMICLKPVPEAEKRVRSRGSAPVSRELDGKLYAGHEAFEWLLAVVSHIMSNQKHMRKGEYLWELVHPKDKDGCLPARSPSGRYRVKLFLMDTWRAVTIDDRIPVDLFGRALLVGSRPLQLWPLLLCKALLKVMAVFQVLDAPPHHVAAFQMLTGWPQEDLLDALSGTALAGGALFNRLEAVLGGPSSPQQDSSAVVSCCLVRRSKPQRVPPRLLVLTGPSGVGRAALVARLVAEFPDKFGATISHTSRPPREHEVDGKDYHFTDKRGLLAGVKAKKFLEAARVAVHARPCNSSAAAAAAAPPRPVSWWYGTSLATVREVAATGKLCLMSLDVQGAAALHSNKRIDGLYLYVATSSPDLLAARQKARPAEAAATLAKRTAWARQQVAKSAAPGLFDAVIPNTDLGEVYAALKEAICTLSPIIRNRLRGLPAYVLDYSDLIPPNSVEKPFLKPVVLAGPDTGERRRLLEMLAEEFPDVFAFPRQHTTRRRDALARHLGAAGDELQLVMADKPGSGSVAGDAAGGAESAAAAPAETDDSSSSSSSSSKNNSLLLGPAPVVLSGEEFDAAAAGGRFLEWHADLFCHPLVTAKHGHSLEHVREVIKAGKLPLLALEAEGAEALRAQGVDCLAIFLAPPSADAYEQRLREWATETDEEVAERQQVAAAEAAGLAATGVFDQVIVNDELEAGYQQLKQVISRFRPDLISASDDQAAEQARAAAASKQPVPLVLLGPTGGGSDQLAQQLLQRFPHRFAVPRKLTDRKPGKAEKETPGMEYCKPDALAKLQAQGQVVWSRQDAATGTTQAVTAEALAELSAAGKMAVLDLGAVTAQQLQAVRDHPAMTGAFVALVCGSGVLKAHLAAAGVAEPVAAQQLEQAAALKQELKAAALVQAEVSHDEPEEAFAQLQEVLSLACPWALPPLLLPLVVTGPFGSGKRAVLQQLIQSLPDVIGVPRTVTTKPRPPGCATPEDMEVVSAEAAQRMLADGAFLVSDTVLGHTYGITSASVRKLQACGKLPLLDLDRVADAARLKAAGFHATYVSLQPSSLEQLQQHITADMLASPGLQRYGQPDAAHAAAAQAVQEATAAAEQAGLFEAVVQHDLQDVSSTVGRLTEVLHRHYPSVVTSSCVWGFGRPLWDAACRVYGRKPLRLMLLGPAASGKSTLCARLAARFGLPHINAGDLLYAEVAASTELGLQAKQFMDASKTVPDQLLLTLLLRRLAAPDCQAQGWALDGFPHTRQQSRVLAEAGHEPDKVVMLEGPHALLLDHVKYRRIDYATGKVYHLAEAGALSEAVLPVRPDGSPDTEVLARLALRHDDSAENVANRLALWDKQVPGLLAAYEDVTLRLPAAGSLGELCGRAEAFVTLEADALAPAAGPGAGGSSCAVGPVIASHQLEELSYRVVAAARYQRQQLVQVQQLDGRQAWVRLQELHSNSSCLLLTHNPARLPVVKSAKCLGGSGCAAWQLVAVESAEPLELLVCLSMGPQLAALPPPAFQKQVVVLAGPAAAGRRSVALQLLRDMPDKLMAAPLLTNRVPHKREVASSSSSSTPSTGGSMTFASDSSGLLHFLPEQQFEVLQRAGQLSGMCQHLEHNYAVSAAALEAAAVQGKAALVVGPLQLAEQLRQQLTDTKVVCLFVAAESESLDVRLRQGGIEEARLQQLLQDAHLQGQLLQQLLQKQEQEAREEQLRLQLQAVTVAPPDGTSSGAAAGRAVASVASAAGGKPPAIVVPAATAAPAVPALAGLAASTGAAAAQQPPLHADWLSAVANPAGKLQTCYSQVQAALCKHLPMQQQSMPGLLLVQRFLGPAGEAGAVVPAAAAGASSAGKQQQQPEQQLSAAVGLDDGSTSQMHTLLRLRARTAAAAMLHLPRGKHLLQLQCSQMLLHCVSLHASHDFALDAAAKLLPAARGLHVIEEQGHHEALSAGSRSLLFRFALRPGEPCTASFQLHASSASLQACSTLLLVDNGSLGQAVRHVLNAPCQLPLAAHAAGYTLLALAEPHAGVPAGSWAVTVTSSQALPQLQAVPAGKQVLLEGAYVANAKAVLARHVITAAAAVQVALLSQLSTAPAAASTNTALGYALRVFDTSSSKEVLWTASYPLLAEAVGGADGRAALPSVQLAPGRYLVVLQLLPAGPGGQWVDPLTGGAEPPPHWQLLCLPSADEKVCCITRDDSYERHFKATMEGWQQQQQQVADVHGGSGSRPPSSGTAAGTAARAAAAARDRPRLAQAALDRHMAAEQQAKEAAAAAAAAAAEGTAAVGQAASANSGSVAAGPVTAAGAAGAAAASHGSSAAAAARKPVAAGGHKQGRASSVAAASAAGAAGPAVAAEGTGSAGGSLQATPRLVATGAGGQQQPSAASVGRAVVIVTRQLKGAAVLQLTPGEQVKHVPADHPAAAVATAPRQQLPAADQHGEFAKQQLPAIGVLQAQQACEFAGWRDKALSDVQASASRNAGLLQAMMPAGVTAERLAAVAAAAAAAVPAAAVAATPAGQKQHEAKPGRR